MKEVNTGDYKIDSYEDFIVFANLMHGMLVSVPLPDGFLIQVKVSIKTAKEITKFINQAYNTNYELLGALKIHGLQFVFDIRDAQLNGQAHS